ncbi:nuclease [Candidatus Woesearchaeota archaeon]|nr:nuclease [Candidatus Woesearchaeota archaeon]
MKKRIDHWIDGDTGIFTDGRIFRLAGVRAPEHHQFGGETATRRVAGMTGQSNGLVNVRRVGGSYGRDVVELRNGDGSINGRMRSRGYTHSGR